MGRGKFAPSLALFRRALADAAGGPEAWIIHFAYAECLNGAAFEVVDRLGVVGPQQSLSARRIALLREAAAHLDTAERIAGDARAIGLIRCRRGAFLEVWGFPMDAYGWYRAALNADPKCGEAAARLLRVSTLLRGWSGPMSGPAGR